MDNEHLLYETAGGLATITLNRPEKLNALTFALVDALVGTLKAAEADPDVHVIVLKGRGRAFSVGLDVQEQSRPHQDPRVRGLRLDAMEIFEVTERFARLWLLHKPIIVQAQGYVLGWALEIALFADAIIATEDAQFGYVNVKNGTGLPDSSMALYHLGPQWAKRLLLTGDTVDGKTAERIGLVLKAVPADQLEAEVQDLALRMTTVPVEVLHASKSVLNRAIDLMGRPVLQQFASETNALSRMNPFVAEWTHRVRDEGIHAALAWREERLRAPRPSNGRSQTMEKDNIRYEAAGGIATITFNRPEKLNAILPPMHQAFLAALRVAEADPEIHVIVLKGAGRAFSAGSTCPTRSRTRRARAWTRWRSTRRPRAGRSFGRTTSRSSCRRTATWSAGGWRSPSMPTS
jgi:enoyl-CoA hydratase